MPNAADRSRKIGLNHWNLPCGVIVKTLTLTRTVLAEWCWQRPLSGLRQGTRCL